MDKLFPQSKSKVVFEVEVIVKGLENLPYLSGLYFVKWSMRKSLAKGFTERQTVRNNVVEWNSHISLPETSMKIGKDGVLQYVVTLYPLTPPSLPGPVTWTCISAKRPMAENDSTRLAVFPLIWPASALLSNLPEFADTRSSERRYLLQDSKLNTFTTVVINIHLISGDPSYKVPQADQDVGDALLAGGPGVLHRGMSITKLITRDEQASSPEFVKAEVIQERRDDEAAVDEIFRAARMK
ncbi:MAG: hypothetical protein SGCHY_003205 [Lobulomycetales sp.]